MIGQIIQKMQELASSDGNYNYQVTLLNNASEKENENVMAVFDCPYDDARQVEGMLSTNFGLVKGQKTYSIGITRIEKK